MQRQYKQFLLALSFFSSPLSACVQMQVQQKQRTLLLTTYDLLNQQTFLTVLTALQCIESPHMQAKSLDHKATLLSLETFEESQNPDPIKSAPDKNTKNKRCIITIKDGHILIYRPSTLKKTLNYLRISPFSSHVKNRTELNYEILQNISIIGSQIKDHVTQHTTIYDSILQEITSHAKDGGIISCVVDKGSQRTYCALVNKASNLICSSITDGKTIQYLIINCTKIKNIFWITPSYLLVHSEGLHEARNRISLYHIPPKTYDDSTLARRKLIKYPTDWDIIDCMPDPLSSLALYLKIKLDNNYHIVKKFLHKPDFVTLEKNISRDTPLSVLHTSTSSDFFLIQKTKSTIDCIPYEKTSLSIENMTHYINAKKKSLITRKSLYVNPNSSTPQQRELLQKIRPVVTQNWIDNNVNDYAISTAQQHAQLCIDAQNIYKNIIKPHYAKLNVLQPCGR